MNTRKRSVRIDHLQNNMISKRQETKRKLRNGVAILLLSGGLLAGCSTGTSNEAERGKQEDSQHESVITDMQATHTWELINSTPDSTPEETPES